MQMRSDDKNRKRQNPGLKLQARPERQQEERDWKNKRPTSMIKKPTAVS